MTWARYILQYHQNDSALILPLSVKALERSTLGLATASCNGDIEACTISFRFCLYACYLLADTAARTGLHFIGQLLGQSRISARQSLICEGS